MKKIILAALAVMALMFGSAQATTFTADIGTMVNQPSNQYSRAFDVRVQQENLGIQLTETGSINRVESDYNIVPLQAFKFVSVSVGAGDATGGGVIGHYTYSVEPKLTVPVGAGISINAGFKYRNSLTTSVSDETRTATLGATYKLTDRVDINIKGQQVRGTIVQNIASVGTSCSF